MNHDIEILVALIKHNNAIKLNKNFPLLHRVEAECKALMYFEELLNNHAKGNSRLCHRWLEKRK